MNIPSSSNGPTRNSSTPGQSVLQSLLDEMDTVAANSPQDRFEPASGDRIIECMRLAKAMRRN